MQRSSGNYAIDAVTLLASRVDALPQTLEKLGTSPTPGGPLESLVGVYAICKT